MNREEIKAELAIILDPYIDHKTATTDVTEQSDLLNDLNINSAHMVDIVLDIEEKFDIMIEDDFIGKMDTVGDAIDVIQEKLS